MEAECLEKWMTKVLTEGVEVKQLYPNTYDGTNGFGYEIMFLIGNQQYNVQFTHKTHKTPDDAPFVIRKIYRQQWDSEEEVSIESIIGRELEFEPKETKTYGYDTSQLAITGTLILKSEPP